MSTILLVGEVNPLSTKPEHALYPWPPNCTGERLQRLVLGVSRRDYLAGFDRVDLCTGRWSAPAARAVVLPHPSGLCRAWHELGAYERARSVLRQAGALRGA